MCNVTLAAHLSVPCQSLASLIPFGVPNPITKTMVTMLMTWEMRHWTTRRPDHLGARSRRTR